MLFEENEKTEAQKVTDYILSKMTPEEIANIPLVFTEHKINFAPRKLNVVWNE